MDAHIQEKVDATIPPLGKGGNMYYLMAIIEWLLRPFHRYYERLMAATGRGCRWHWVVWYYRNKAGDRQYVDAVDDYPVTGVDSIATIDHPIPWYWRAYVARQLLRDRVWAVVFLEGRVAWRKLYPPHVVPPHVIPLVKREQERLRRLKEEG